MLLQMTGKNLNYVTEWK